MSIAEPPQRLGHSPSPLLASLYLLGKSRGARLLLLMAALTPGAAILSSRMLELRDQAALKLQGGQGVTEVAAANAYSVSAKGASYGFLMLGLAFVAWCAATTSRQFESTHIRGLWCRGVSRSRWFFYQTLTLHTCLLLSITVLLISSASLSALLYDYGPIAEEGIEIYSEEELWVEIRRALWGTLLPLSTVLALGQFLGVLFRSSGMAISAALLLTFGIDLFQDVTPWGRSLYASYLPSLRDHSSWRELCKFLEGFSDAGFDASTWSSNLWVPLLQTLLLLGLTWVRICWRRV